MLLHQYNHLTLEKKDIATFGLRRRVLEMTTKDGQKLKVGNA